MEKTKIKIHVEAGHSIPMYKSEDAAGCDIIYSGEQPITLRSLDRAFIKSGISIQLPEGYEAQVRSRSGLNKNHGIVCITGTIDSDYRGDIGVILYNLSREPYTIYPGDRIAQLVICPVIQADWLQVESLNPTDRGDGGLDQPENNNKMETTFKIGNRVRVSEISDYQSNRGGQKLILERLRTL